MNDMALRLTKVLDENDPFHRGVTAKAALTIFRKWQERKVVADEVQRA